jgi:hypothetical protein
MNSVKIRLLSNGIFIYFYKPNNIYHQSMFNPIPMVKHGSSQGFLGLFFNKKNG